MILIATYNNSLAPYLQDININYRDYWYDTVGGLGKYTDYPFDVAAQLTHHFVRVTKDMNQ